MRRLIPSLLALALLTACAGRSGPQTPPPSDAQRLLAAGQQALADEHFSMALGRLQDARVLARSLDDTETQIRAVMGQIDIALIREQSDTAAALAGTLDALARRDGVSALTRAQTTYMLARVDAAHGRSALARQRIAPLIQRRDALGQVARLLDCRELLAAGPSNCAEPLHASEPLLNARSQRLRAEAAVHDHQAEQAMQWLESARGLYRQLGQRTGVAATLETLAQVAARAGDWPRACDAMTRGLGANLGIRNAPASRRLVGSLAQHCATEPHRQAVLDQLRLALPEDRPARWHRAAALLEQYEATLHSPAPARPR